MKTVIDHLIDSKQDSFLVTCMYCNSTLDDRNSEFIENFHYKSITCPECGKIHRHPVDFLGDGNDPWNQDVLRIARKNIEN
jgi:RNase P subunit RPR2